MKPVDRLDAARELGRSIARSHVTTTKQREALARAVKLHATDQRAA